MNPRALALAALVAASALTAAIAPVATAATPDAPDASIDHSGDELSLTAGPAQAITGEVDLPPGTELSVRVQSTHSPSRGFIQRQTATVDRDGRFYALFDFSGVSPNATADVTVVTDSGPAASVEATFTECREACGDGESGDDADSASNDSGSVADDSLSLSFDELAVEEEAVGPAGDVVRVTVAMGDAEVATVSIGGRAVGYELNATVTDGNGDDRVDLAFDTSATGENPTVRAVDTADSATVTAEEDLPERATRLADGEYPVALYRGEAASGDPDDVGTMQLTEVDADQWGDGTNENDTDSVPNVGFGDASVTVDAGSTATLELAMAEENATVVVEGDRGYETTLTARDGDDDGRVVVRLDTAVVDGETPVSVVGSTDSVAVVSASVPANATTNGTLTPGDYTLLFHPGASTDGDASDLGVLYVQSASQSDLTPADRNGSGASVPPELALGAGALVAAGGVGLLVRAR